MPLQVSAAMQEALAKVTATKECCTAADGELTAASDALQRAEASFLVLRSVALQGLSLPGSSG